MSVKKFDTAWMNLNEPQKSQNETTNLNESEWFVTSLERISAQTWRVKWVLNLCLNESWQVLLKSDWFQKHFERLNEF